MHLKTLKEAKSKAGSTDGGFLYSTTVRTVDREKPRSRMSRAVTDRWATNWWHLQDLTVSSSTKINRGCRVINGMWEMVTGNSDGLSTGIILRRTQSHERRRDVTTPGWAVETGWSGWRKNKTARTTCQTLSTQVG